MLLNMLTPTAAGRLCADLAAAARTAGRPVPRTAIWLATAVEPTPDTITQISRGKVGYLAAPGYGEMFIEAGFGNLVAFARTRPHPRDLLAAINPDVVDSVGLVGSSEHIAERIAEYHAAGVDEVCIVPATAGDDGGRRTLEALAHIGRSD